MADRGFPLTPKMVRAFGWAISHREGTANRFPEGGPSANWFTRFRRYHPQLSLRKIDNLERSRAECLSTGTITRYFFLLNDTLTKNGLKNKPRQIYNADESFLQLNETKEKAVTTKNSRFVFSQSLGTTEHITVLCGASASGVALPPMIIYPRSFPGGQYRFGGPDDPVYARSESGWVDNELFVECIRRVFLKFAVPDRPLLLVIDDHKTHLTLECIDLCRTNNIILLCLPPHTTHALQPLDVSVFRSLKCHFSSALQAVCFSRKDFMVTKRDFARVFKVPFEKAFSMSNIKSGFTKTRIYPFNPEAIDKEKLVPSDVHDTQTGESSSGSEETLTQENPLDATPTQEPSHTTLAQENSSHTTPTQENPSYATPSQEEPSHTTPTQENPSNTSQTSVICPETNSSSSSCGITPPLFSSPSYVSETSTSPEIVNPLVTAGLVPQNLSDILVPCNIPVPKRRRIVDARVVTEDEYYTILVEKDAKEKAEKQAKEKRKILREKKKEERLQLKMAKKEMKIKTNAKKSKGSRKQKKSATTSKKAGKTRMSDPLSSSSEAESPVISRKRKLPARYVQDNSSHKVSSGDESDTVCGKCELRNPLNNNDKHIFWIDCEKCDAWFHVCCITTSARQLRPPSKYMCDNCA